MFEKVKNLANIFSKITVCVLFASQSIFLHYGAWTHK